MDKRRGTRWGAVLATVAASVLAGPGAAAVENLPGTEVSSPAIVSVGTGRLDVLSKPSGDDLTHQHLLPGGSWGRPLNRGGTLESQPVAVSWAAGRLDVFARGTDDQLWHRSYASGTWAAWERLGGRLTSAPAVATWAPGHLDVFVRGTDNAMYQKTLDAGVWSGWTKVGGLLTASPAVASWGPGRLDVVVRSSGDRAYHTSYVSGTGWSGWTSLGAALTAQPAIASPAAGLLDVVVRGQNARMYLKRYSDPGGWTGWSRLDATTFTSGPAMTAIGQQLVVAARRSNGFVYRRVRATPSAAWSSWRIIDQYLPLRRLATWVDTLDYTSLDPAASVADMKARGVRTLLLSTARFNSSNDFFDQTRMADWLDRAHAAGIRVVGWYVPGYGDMVRDMRRTAAIDAYVSPAGQRFDAIGVDIERFGASGEVDRSTFNARVVPHLQQVRAVTAAPLVAIVPSPYGTDPGNNWEGFPWSGIGPNSEVVVPMALWSFRSNFSATQVHDWVADQVDRTQALTGRRVHVEGGVIGEGRTPVSASRVQAFVDAVIGAGAIGGSQYDYNTMNGDTEPTNLWAVLDGLNAP